MKTRKYLFITFLFTIMFLFTNVCALEIHNHGTGEHRLRFDFDANGYPVTSVKINGVEWEASTNEDIHEYLTGDENTYTIVILAGKKDNSFPRAETPGGYDTYGKYDSRPNPNDDAGVAGDEYIITLTLTNYNDDWDNEFEHFGTMIVDGPEPVASGHITSNLNITINGEDLEWHELSDEASHFTFAFGDAEMIFLDGANLTFTRENDKIVQGRTTNAIQMEYNYTNDTVTLHMHTNPSEYIQSMTINGDNYTDRVPNTPETMAANFYRDMLCISFDIENIPVRDTYNIVINAVHLDREHQITGGFGWNYSKDGDVDEASDRIPYGKIEFVKAIYNNVEYTSVAEFKAANRLFEWVDGEKKEEYPIGDRSQFGYTFFPTGARVTIKIIPDTGYQLVGLRNQGNEFTRENEPGVYTFNMTGGSAALGANFEPVDNEVRPNADRVKNGAISNVEFVNGTAKLEIDNVASMSPEREEKFVEAAAEYEIDNYLEISLYNTIYKGGEKDENNNYLAWDTEITNLQNNAVIELQMDDIDGEVAIIHEKHGENNQNEYEVIPAQYNSETHTITFETKSFSTYAVATKGGEEHQDENQARVIYNTRSDDVIEDAIINKGDKAPKPRDPEHEDGLEFLGWYTTEACNEEYDFNLVVDVDRLEIFAKWSDPEGHHDDGDKDTQYVVKEGDNEISFKEEEGHTYHFEMIDYLSFTKEEVMKKEGITSKMYDQIFGGVKSQAEKNGTFLFFFNIRVYENVKPDPNDPEDDGIRDIHDGPFTVKIKMTDELKKYTNFKMYYVNEDFTLDKEAIEFNVSEDGKYLVGTLKHLSPYVLVGDAVGNGDNTDNVKTNDGINTYLVLLLVSVFGLSVIPFTYLKNNKNNI